jgi:hypothetical protein
MIGGGPVKGASANTKQCQCCRQEIISEERIHCTVTRYSDMTRLTND